VLSPVSNLYRSSDDIQAFPDSIQIFGQQQA
jgi:hypothetical protein